MGKKKKPKKAKSITSLTSEQKEALTSLLKRAKDTDPVSLVAEINSPALARALIEKLPSDEESPLELVFAISEAFPQKEVQKAIRKFLFKLKAKGIKAPDLPPTTKSTPVLVPPTQEEPRAYVGSYDPSWVRLVILAIPRRPRGFDVAICAINDAVGIDEFNWSLFSKKSLRELEKDLETASPFKMVETSMEHALWCIERAYGISNNKSSQACMEYDRFKAYVGIEISPPERPFVYDLIDEARVKEGRISLWQLETLFEDKMFMAPFLLKPDEISSLVQELDKVSESPIIISKAQAMEMEKKIRKEWLRKKFPEQERRILKYRLEETAYILAKLGKDEEALAALLSAKEMEKELTEFHENPFLEFLLDLSLDLYEELREFEEDLEPSEDESRIEAPESPLIIKP